MEVILWLIIPVLVSGQITVEIKATGFEESSTAAANGYILELINDEDVLAFGLIEESFQRAVEKISGSQAEEETNDGHYFENGWAQVTRRLAPASIAITKIEKRPVTFERKISNEGSELDEINVAFSPDILYSVSSTWVERYDSNVGQPIGYEVVMGEHGEGSVGYASPWGESADQSRRMQIAEFPMALDAGDSVVTTLSVTENVMAVEIKYNATLAGPVAYKNASGSHDIEVNEVLEALGLPLVMAASESMTIRFYSDANLRVQHLSTGIVILEIPVRMYPE